MTHDSGLYETWLIPQRDVTRLCVWHYAFLCVVWLQLSHWSAWRDAFLYETPPMTPSYLRHDSFLYETYAFLCETRRICTCTVTYSYMRHVPWLCIPIGTHSEGPCRVSEYVTVHVQMSHVSYRNANNSVKFLREKPCITWLFCEKSPALHGTFAERAPCLIEYLRSGHMWMIPLYHCCEKSPILFGSFAGWASYTTENLRCGHVRLISLEHFCGKSPILHCFLRKEPSILSSICKVATCDLFRWSTRWYIDSVEILLRKEPYIIWLFCGNSPLHYVVPAKWPRATDSVGALAYTWIPAHRNLVSHAHAHTYTRTHTHSQTHKHKHTREHTHTHTYINTWIREHCSLVVHKQYTHTSVCVCGVCVRVRV